VKRRRAVFRKKFFTIINLSLKLYIESERRVCSTLSKVSHFLPSPLRSRQQNVINIIPEVEKLESAVMTDLSEKEGGLDRLSVPKKKKPVGLHLSPDLFADLRRNSSYLFVVRTCRPIVNALN
jgi:hypothetical protein